MKVHSLLETLHAAQHTWLVEGPWDERGGILLVAPPGQLKTTLVYTLDNYSDALCCSDVNIHSLKSIRDSVLGGRYHTIAFGEMEKLYARNPATAANIEAHLKQFVEEGLRHFSHEDSSAPIMPARCMVIAGITPSALGKMYSIWNESGFLRRFLRIQYTMRDQKTILEAVHAWKKITMTMPTIWNGRLVLKYNLEDKDSKFVMVLMKDQPYSTPTILVKRIAVVLKEIRPDTWRDILRDIGPSFGKNGAMLEI